MFSIWMSLQTNPAACYGVQTSTASSAKTDTAHWLVIHSVAKSSGRAVTFPLSSATKALATIYQRQWAYKIVKGLCKILCVYVFCGDVERTQLMLQLLQLKIRSSVAKAMSNHFEGSIPPTVATGENIRYCVTCSFPLLLTWEMNDIVLVPVSWTCIFYYFYRTTAPSNFSQPYCVEASVSVRAEYPP